MFNIEDRIREVQHKMYMTDNVEELATFRAELKDLHYQLSKGRLKEFRSKQTYFKNREKIYAGE